MASARVSRGRKYGMGRRYALKVMVLGVVGLMSLAGTNPVMAASTQNNGSFWTQFTPSSDTRLIFVSSSEGNDANNGLTPATPVKTLARGHELLRNGFPDWMLLKRGDTWNESFPAWSKNGRSESEMLVVGAYGDAPDRPKIRPANGVSGMNVVGTRLTNHIAFVGFHLEPAERVDGVTPTGIRWLRRSKNILFEDLYVRGFKDNFNLTGGEGTPVEDIRINGCIIADAWSDRSHSQGLFANRVNGLVIENSIFDSNGFNHDEGASPTIFNHNLYIQHGTKNVAVRNNIIANASSHGIQLRPGGRIEGNVFLNNPIQILISMDVGSAAGDADNVVRRNLVMYGRDISPDIPRRFGMDIGNIRGVEVAENIFYSSPEGVNGRVLTISGGTDRGIEDVVVERNRFIDWGGEVLLQAPGSSDYKRIAFRENVIYRDLSGSNKPLVNVFAANHPEVTISSNEYRFFGLSDRPFRVGSAWTTFDQWKSAVEPDASVRPGSTLPSVGIEAYMASIGYAGADLESFLAEARKLSRQNLRPEFLPSTVFNWAASQLD